MHLRCPRTARIFRAARRWTLRKSKFVIAALLGASAALVMGAAQARDLDVQWSVTIGTPVYRQPVPVYTAPPPVYSVPAPVYRAPVVVLRRPVVPIVHYRRPTAWDRDGDGIPNRYDRIYNPAWDRDGDGIPNRHDRLYNPVWDRDGDGIPNHRDARYNPRYNPRWDRDGDGVPNRHDRHDRGRDGYAGRQF
jgi:hypothetical protein